MAKQVGPLFFTGTVDGIIFYKLGDNYYMRSKGDYKSGKQMRKDPSYKRTLQRADQFGQASKVLKPVYYRYLPREVRKHGLYGKLTGVVNRWLQEGKTKEEARALLIAHCQQLAAAATPAAPSTSKAVKPSINEQRSTTTVQRTTANHQPSSVNCPPPTNNAQRSTDNALHKRPRYLSRWKVKRNGRLDRGLIGLVKDGQDY